jgi:CHAT domain-containing protein
MVCETSRFWLLVVGLASPAAGLAQGPASIVRAIQIQIDRDGGRALESTWRARLTRRPEDPSARLAVATFERNRYRYERSDSLLRLIELAPGIGADWKSMAIVGRALWRSLGSDVRAADSLLVFARDLARSVKAREVEAEALLGLVALRSRTLGPREGKQLLAEWWRTTPRAEAQDSALHLCQGGALDDQLGDTTGYGRVVAGARLAERWRSWRLAGNCRLGIAQIAERRGYIAGARPPARLALKAFRRIGYDLGVALAGQWYGYLLVRSHAFAEGRAQLEEAVAAAKRTRFESVEAWAYAGLAGMYLTLGEASIARRYATIAAASHERRGDRWGLASARSFEAASLQATGDLVGAAAKYADAQHAYLTAQIPTVAPTVARANLLLRLAWLDSAERALMDGARIGRTSDAWRVVEEPLLRAGLALRRGRMDEADSLVRATPFSQRWRRGDTQVSSVVLAARETQVALRRGDMARADSALGFVTSAIDSWRMDARNRDVSASLAQLGVSWSGLAELYPDIVGQLVARNRVADAFEFVERLRAREVVERRLRSVALEVHRTQLAVSSGAPTREAEPLSLSRVQESLASEEAVVSYVMGLDESPTTAIVVTRETVRALRLPTRASLVPDIERFARLAAAGTEATAVSRRLADALVEPVVTHLPASITRLVISADGELHRVPFDALRLADGRYALERFTISSTPSGAALVALRSARVPATRRVVAIGDPSYRAAPGPALPTEDRGSDGRAAAELPRLRFSGEEARLVAQYGERSTLLVGAQATEAALARAAAGAAVLHIAAHGLVDDFGQATTSLAVAPGDGGDGFLTTTELAQLRLDGSLVVLSACRSSGGQTLGGEGLRGLTAPLLQAGARAVVGTHWSIGDRSVVPFVDRFYRAMADGVRPDDALRVTKLEAIRGGVSIADWATFTLVGEGSSPPALRPRGRAALAPWVRGTAQVLRDTASSAR